MVDQFLALLRGINVGGKNLVKMTELAACFREAGYADVATYIQSGNVLFGADHAGGPALETELEEMLEGAFAMPLRVVVRSHDELAATVAAAPAGFGGPDDRCDVIFLKHPTTAEEVIAGLPPLAEGVDRVWPGPGAVFFSRVAALATRSRLGKIVGTPVYQQMTIRNWNTTSRLASMLDERARA